MTSSSFKVHNEDKLRELEKMTRKQVITKSQAWIDYDLLYGLIDTQNHRWCKIL